MGEPNACGRSKHDQGDSIAHRRAQTRVVMHISIGNSHAAPA
jgi:hypothetical protein